MRATSHLMRLTLSCMISCGSVGVNDISMLRLWAFCRLRCYTRGEECSP